MNSSYSSLLLLLVIAGQVYPMNQPAQTSEQQELTQANARLNQIKQEFNIIGPQSCALAISKDKPQSIQGFTHEQSLNFQVACILLGYKNVYIGTQELDKEFPLLDPAFQYLIENREDISYFPVDLPVISRLAKKPETAKNLVKHLFTDPAEFDAQEYIRREWVLYTQAGERKAHLLGLYLAQESAGVIAANGYLLGLLLDYPERDLTYFYQVNSTVGDDFIRYYDDNASNYKPDPQRPVRPYNYAQWPWRAKNAFGYYVRALWPTTGAHREFESDKQQAIAWLGQYANLTLDELEAVMKDALQQLKNRADSLLTNVQTNSTTLKATFAAL